MVQNRRLFTSTRVLKYAASNADQGAAITSERIKSWKQGRQKVNQRRYSSMSNSFGRNTLLIAKGRR